MISRSCVKRPLLYPALLTMILLLICLLLRTKSTGKTTREVSMPASAPEQTAPAAVNCCVSTTYITPILFSMQYALKVP